LPTLHLAKAYCVPTVLYGCKTWHLDCHEYRRLKFIWNNSIRKIFGCCWRESVSCFLFYCQALPIPYLIDQRIILFWKKTLICDNSIIQTLAAINRSNVGLILSKYNLLSINISVYGIKQRMWEHFADVAHDRGQIVFC